MLEELELRAGTPAAWRDGTDVVGGAYERLLPAATRRAAGQFFTPFWAGEVMSRWVMAGSPRLVLDPGCGSGALLIEAARARGRRATRLLGIDKDPLAVQMAGVNRRLRGLGRCELRASDFLLDALAETPDAVVCNPPYSRHHAIPPSDKAAIHDGFEARLGVRLSRLAGLHVLFLLRALEVCAGGGRIAFITPSDWLDVGYGARVKELVLERASVEAVVKLPADRLLFGEVLTTSSITLIRKVAGSGSATRLVELGSELPPAERVLAAISGAGDLAVRDVSLDAGAKWSRPGRRRGAGVRLGDVARVRRGIATGCNRFFVLSEEERLRRGLPLSDLRPCITSPRLLPGTVLRQADLDALPNAVPRWVLDRREPGAEAGDDALGRYLRWGRRRLKAHRGYLASRRSPWFALESRGSSPILFTYFNRARPRFVRNDAGAVPLNTWLIVEPNEGVSPDELFRVLTSAFVVGALEAGSRVYGSGLWKLEPSELEDVRLPSAGTATLPRTQNPL